MLVWLSMQYAVGIETKVYYKNQKRNIFFNHGYKSDVNLLQI